MNRCPQRAIETAHGFIVGLFILVDFVLVKQLYSLTIIDEYITKLPIILGKTLDVIINTIILFGVLLISYRLLHYLLKFSIFEKLIVYTSLTKYKFWRRYKAPKLETTEK
jgi:hypothetical protein